MISFLSIGTWKENVKSLILGYNSCSIPVLNYTKLSKLLCFRSLIFLLIFFCLLLSITKISVLKSFI